VKILFDECMPQPLRRRLTEFEIFTAIQALRPGDYKELDL
jgi:hypothetical protein